MFYTPVTLYSPKEKITLKDSVITAGSCFADCMGRKFERHKFNAFTSPFGTVYNPLSLQKQFLNTIDKAEISKEDIVSVQDIYFHYDYHSDLKGKSQEELLDSIRKKQEQVFLFLKSARWFIITWGTSWVYENERNTVANCHKQPQKIFRRRLLDEKLIVEGFNKFLERLKSFNPEIRIILTVSPVRHIRDTLPMNAVSKSILRTAAHYAEEQNDDVWYFPAYEIMIDELRDYRFYKEDMIHPTPQAEDYIWNSFKEVSMDEETKVFIDHWLEIRKALSHNAFNPISEQHQKFLKNTLQKLEELSHKVDVSHELDELRRQVL